MEIIQSVVTMKTSKSKTKTCTHGLIDHEIITMLRRIGRKIAKKFELKFKSITIMHPSDPEHGTCLGYCDEDRNIIIDIRRGRRYQTFEEVIDTLIHELAHLDHLEGDNDEEWHNNDWRKRYDKYYYWLRKNLSKKDNETLFCEDIIHGKIKPT